MLPAPPCADGLSRNGHSDAHGGGAAGARAKGTDEDRSHHGNESRAEPRATALADARGGRLARVSTPLPARSRPLRADRSQSVHRPVDDGRRRDAPTRRSRRLRRGGSRWAQRGPRRADLRRAARARSARLPARVLQERRFVRDTSRTRRRRRGRTLTARSKAQEDSRASVSPEARRRAGARRAARIALRFGASAKCKV